VVDAMGAAGTRAIAASAGWLDRAALCATSLVAMGDSKAVARRRFDRWARRYERDRRSRANAGPQTAALAAAALAADDRFLDVGCGTGAAIRAAAEMVERAVGVDISTGMIERARELAAGLGNVEFIVGDSEQLPFPDETFTAVMCSSSFHHYPDPAQALGEMARVLTCGGRLVIAEPNADLALVRIADRVLRRVDRSHVRLYRGAELAALACAAGFDDAATRPLGIRGYLLLSGHRS
jgi:ubiquinone/menaquinone biosynthesis C-methylase UbiE